MKSVSDLLLTGGTGFFGRALLRYWIAGAGQLDTPSHVTVLSRNPDAFKEAYPEFRAVPWLRFTQGDVCDSASLPSGMAYSHIIHAAADSTLGPQLSCLSRYDQIVNGTRNVLDLAARCQSARVLFMSSGAVYGPQPAHLPKLPEDWLGMSDPLIPANAYGIAKKTAEHLCALYADAFGIQTVIARCFAFVGPDLPLGVHFAVGNFIRDALRGKEITVSGDGTAIRSYLDQRDLSHWLYSLLMRGRPGHAYNVGSEQAITMADLALLVRDTLAPEKPIRVLGVRSAANERSRYVPNVEKIQAELMLRQTISLAESIDYTAREVIKRGAYSTG